MNATIPFRWLKRYLPPLVLACVPPSAAMAQTAPATLTLDDAIALARRSNPGYRARLNDESAADWRVREAYGALLPGASADLGLQYQARGNPRLGIFTGADLGLTETPPYYFSDYSIGFSYRLGPAVVFRLGEERARRRAVVAGIEEADFTLRAQVTRQYLAVLRAQDAAELARSERESAAENLKLSTARVRVGAATELESKQAEVEHGRAEVELLRAENLIETEMLRLTELLGIVLDRPIRLTSTFEVFDPPWDADALVQQALEAHPRLRSLRATEDAGTAAVRSAKSGYLPSLSLSAGWSGFTRQVGDAGYVLDQAHQRAESSIAGCQQMNRISAGLSQPLPGYPTDCAGYALTSEDEARILGENDVFPFRFTRQPLAARIQISLPLFQGFRQRREVEAARVAADDARHDRRAEELRRRTEVVTAVRTLRTAYRAVVLERRNATTAEEQLRLARERYRVGAGNYLELAQAEVQRTRANRDALAAVYGFHGALATLEEAVGRGLRPGADDRR